MSDKKTPFLVFGILGIVGGVFLIIFGIESWYYPFYDYTTYRLNALAYLGIVAFIIGVVLLILAFFTKEKARKQSVCSRCGAETLQSYAVCPNCGAYFKKQCAKCKAPLESTVSYCPHCGSTDFVIPDHAPEPSSCQAPPPAFQPQQTPPPTAPGVRSCISCGKELRPESKYCPWCGTVAR